MALIELAHVHERLAWFPAQLVAWVVVSYPLFRYVVFAAPRLGAAARERAGEAERACPLV